LALRAVSTPCANRARIAHLRLDRSPTTGRVLHGVPPGFIAGSGLKLSNSCHSSFGCKPHLTTREVNQTIRQSRSVVCLLALPTSNGIFAVSCRFVRELRILERYDVLSCGVGDRNRPRRERRRHEQGRPPWCRLCTFGHGKPFGKERENATVVKLRVRAGESIQEAVRRFRKLCERSGLRKEMRRKAYYEKPSERRRREELKRLRKARQHQTSRV
jgi:small subunit ribosomal protein S21